MKISAVKCAKFLCAVSLVVVSVHVLQLDHARASDGLVTDIATWRIELETKAFRRFAKIKQSRRRTFAWATQFHVYLPWGQRLLA